MLGGPQRQYKTLQERTLLCKVCFGARQGDKDRRESYSGSNLQPKEARVREREHLLSLFDSVCARLCLLDAFFTVYNTSKSSIKDAQCISCACLPALKSELLPSMFNKLSFVFVLPLTVYIQNKAEHTHTHTHTNHGDTRPIFPTHRSTQHL